MRLEADRISFSFSFSVLLFFRPKKENPFTVGLYMRYLLISFCKQNNPNFLAHICYTLLRVLC